MVQPDLAAEHLPAFETLVRSSGSRSGLAMTAEVRGHLAFSAHEWALAADCFTEALAVNPDAPRGWFETTVSWYRLVSMALSGAAAEISASELSDPWRWLREADLSILRWWGASATAIVLERLNNADLASRFRRWIVQTDPGEVGRMMELRLTGAEFRLDCEPTDPVDLDELVEELFEFATARGCS